MATDAILETIKPRRAGEEEQLPVTAAAGAGGGMIGLRRRVSSFSVRFTPPPLSPAAIRRAQSMPSAKALAAAGALRRWWEWGLGWAMAPFARGLEMASGCDDEAAAAAGCQCHHLRGTWRHVLYKVRAGARRLLGRDGRPLRAAAAPQDFRYDSVSYAQNFDDGEA